MKSTIKPTPGHDARRVFIVVLDGAGAGALPDAAAYGDAGANTLLHVLQKHQPVEIPALLSLGLGEVLNLPDDNSPAGFYGRLQPLSPGKDTTSGHWELAGLVLDRPFPVYPQGFPDAVIKPFEEKIGLPVLGNKPASGTEIIEELGEIHLKTGRPIVYTSADSVFQIAAHELVASPEQLYHWCRLAREILQGEHAVGRVIARPFRGVPGSFERTAGRRDFSLPPPGDTLLDLVSRAGYTTAVIGKIADIFAGRGITRHLPGGSNDRVAADLQELAEAVEQGLIWATFGDFDTLYGHRNNSAGFAGALEHFDRFLSNFLQILDPRDLLLITADHGCDPIHPSTDHTREYVPVLAYSPSFRQGGALGTRHFADLAATAAAWLGLSPLPSGTPFLPEER